MTSHLVVLNGPAGVGKTTVAGALAALWSNSACIGGDDLKYQTVNRVPGEVDGRMAYRNGASLSANFLRAGYQAVVFEFVFETPDHVDFFLSALRDAIPTAVGAGMAEDAGRLLSFRIHFRGEPRTVDVHLFTLWAPYSVVETRELGRSDRSRLGSRVRECYLAIEKALPKLGHVIHTGGRPVDELAQEIFALCAPDAQNIAKVESWETTDK